MVDAGNAAALVTSLADLVRAGEVDLTDVERADVEVVQEALAAWLAAFLAS